MRRVRGGEPLDVAAFAAEHPTHAQDIRTLLPALLQLEAIRPSEPAREHRRLGRWEVQRELGRGGMGVVYLAHDPRTGERAALKLLAGRDANSLARFQREAQAVSRVSHVGLCRALEVSADGQVPWIAFEYIEGETVAELLRRRREERDKGRAAPLPSPDEVRRWLEVGEQVALALHAAHEVGLVHRDVKPANLMLSGDRAVVLDFGLAHGDATGEETRITHTGTPVGTPAYMSPEQVRAGPLALDRRTDVYSLGATLYEALTLVPPFQASTVAELFTRILSMEPEPARQLHPALPPSVGLVLGRALEKRPERRYATALSFAEDLARARLGRRVQAKAVGPLRRLWVWAGRHPRLAASIGAAALALVTGLVVALVLLSRVTDARDREALAARRAQARALASTSAEVGRDDGVLALLLAQEAVRAERTPETVSRLHAAVHGSLERARLSGDGAAVSSLAWDCGGTRVVTGSRDGSVRVFGVDGTLQRKLLLASADPQAVGLRVSLSPDGTRVLALSADGAAWLWNVDADRARRLPLSGESATQALFLADGSAVALSDAGNVHVHGADGQPRTSWKVPVPADATGSRVLAAEAARDQASLHVLTRDGHVFDYAVDGVLLGHREQAVGMERPALIGRGRLAFVRGRGSADESLHVVGRDGASLGEQRGAFGSDALLTSGDDFWCVWTPFTGAVLVDALRPERVRRTLDLQRSEGLASLRQSEDGRRCFTARRVPGMRADGAHATDALRTWSGTGAPLGTVTVAGDMVEEAELSPDGSLLALAHHAGGLVTLHATAPSELLTHVPRWRQEDGLRYAPHLTRDGRHVGAFADERTYVVLREDGTRRALLASEREGKTMAWRYLSFHPRLERFLATTVEGGLFAFDLDGKVLPSAVPSERVERAVWVGGAGAFVCHVAGPRVRFHAPDGTLQAEHAGLLVWPDPLKSSPDEVILFVEPGSVCVYDGAGALRRTIPLAPGERTDWVQGSPAGPAVLVATPTDMRARRLGVCRYLDASGRVRWEVPVGGVGNQNAQLSPDGERVASLVSGGLTLRDAQGRERAALRLASGVTHVAFDGLSASLAASAWDGTVRVWDREGRERFSLPNQGGQATLVFSEDGRRLATVTKSMVRLYTTDVDELLALAARRTTRTWSAAERARFADLLRTGR